MAQGLRALKKERTRQAISDTATRLFLERGFDAVTLTEIAAASQVSKMTVTNYFPRKEDLALDHHEEFAICLARTVAARRTGESALDALRDAYLAAVERHDAVVGFTGAPFARMVTGSPTLSARLRDLHDQREDALAEVLAADTAATAATPGDLTPRAAAAQLATAHRTLFAYALDLNLRGSSDRKTAAALNRAAQQVFGLLEGPLADYATR